MTNFDALSIEHTRRSYKRPTQKSKIVHRERLTASTETIHIQTVEEDTNYMVPTPNASQKRKPVVSSMPPGQSNFNNSNNRYTSSAMTKPRTPRDVKKRDRLKKSIVV